jgi:thiamine transport system substrate-binding protein
MYGVDNTFLSRALNEDLFVAYESPLLADVPEEFQLDTEFRVTPVTFGDVCLNYDVAYFEDNDIPLPESLTELTDPIYEGLLVVENPATSSPGLAFLLATIAVFGDEGDYTFVDYWSDLVANDVLITEGWTEAYYTYFSAPGRDGDRPLVVSYASSPPVEMLFADPQPDSAITRAIVADETCFRQIEFVGILDGTENLELAQALVDFTLSLEFQEALPLNMFVFPVHQDAELPDIFAEYTSVPENPVTLDYDAIDENREDWIRAWTEVIRR